jgi:hypothetical protein
MKLYVHEFSFWKTFTYSPICTIFYSLHPVQYERLVIFGSSLSLLGGSIQQPVHANYQFLHIFYIFPVVSKVIGPIYKVSLRRNGHPK